MDQLFSGYFIFMKCLQKPFTKNFTGILNNSKQNDFNKNE